MSFLKCHSSFSLRPQPFGMLLALFCSTQFDGFSALFVCYTKSLQNRKVSSTSADSTPMYGRSSSQVRGRRQMALCIAAHVTLSSLSCLRFFCVAVPCPRFLDLSFLWPFMTIRITLRTVTNFEEQARTTTLTGLCVQLQELSLRFDCL